MKRQGLLTHYNGIDIMQTHDYITLHVGSYVHKVVDNHGWSDMHPVALPMAADNDHTRSLDTATLHPQTTLNVKLSNPVNLPIVVPSVNSFGL